MPDWLQSGPGQLDLTTPLQEGIKIGADAAYRKAQVGLDAAKVQQMQQALGLQAKQMTLTNSLENRRLDLEGSNMDFQHQMWNSQADMREAQMQLTQNDANLAKLHVGNVLNDQQAFHGYVDDWSDAAKSGDPSKLANLRPPLFSTTEGTAAFENWQKQTDQSSLGIATQVYRQLQQTPGLDPKSFYDTAGNFDAPSALQAIQSNMLAVKQAEAENSSAVYKGIIQGQAAANVANIRATASTANNVNSNLTKMNLGDAGNVSKLMGMGYSPGQAQMISQKALTSMNSGHNSDENAGDVLTPQLTAPAPTPAQAAALNINSALGLSPATPSPLTVPAQTPATPPPGGL